jgi:hypothetical protein
MYGLMIFLLIMAFSIVIIAVLLNMGSGSSYTSNPNTFRDYWEEDTRQSQDLKLLRSVSDENTGTDTEQDLVIQLLKMGYTTDQIFHNVYIKYGQDKYSEIDLVLLTDMGVVVIEDKGYSGGIYGNANYDNWYKVKSYYERGGYETTKKETFYNPIKQNQAHINHLRRKINDGTPIHSVIVFSGSCKLYKMENIPQGVFVIKPNELWWALDNIRKQNPEARHDRELVTNILRQGVANGKNPSIVQSHKSRVSQYAAARNNKYNNYKAS